MTFAGSSPRMRGKPGSQVGDLQGLRIIPAHAGQTLTFRYRYRYPTDHPRACGANQMLRKAAKWGYGSSPRMRGKHLQDHDQYRAQRIIPAHAGQTSPRRSTTGPTTDHPRACGANNGQTGNGGLQHGSSPRMRGKRLRTGSRSLRRRIIPAHAGQTQMHAGTMKIQ